MVTGGDDYDPAAAEIQAAVSWIDEQAATWQNTLSTEPDRAFLWPDLTFDGSADDRSLDMRRSYVRVQDMALAYATHGSQFQADSHLHDSIVESLDWLYENHYNEGVEESGNWFDWQIGVPLQLTATSMLLGDDLDSERLADYMQAVDNFCAEPKMTGANRLWTSQIVAQRAILIDDEDKLTTAIEGIYPALQFVESGDGFYADGSFIQHKYYPYTGGYGVRMLGTAAWLFHLVHGSPWQGSDEALSHLTTWVTRGVEPMLHKGAILSPVRGRSIARTTDSDHQSGHSASHAMMWLAPVADPQVEQRLNGLVKHMIMTDEYRPFAEAKQISVLRRSEELMADDSVAARSPTQATHVFPKMDRVVHRRPSFTFAIAMSSARIATYETLRGVNRYGWHTGSGATYLYNDDLGHYDDDYWPTVDLTRLPGTTTPAGVRAGGWGSGYRSDKHWVGGAAVDGLASVGMEFRTYTDGDPADALTGRKSWFMFGDEIAALGSAINGADEQAYTTVENRMIKDVKAQQLHIDGAFVSNRAVDRTVKNPSWAHIGGLTSSSGIGYVFGAGQQLGTRREARSGAWSAISSNPRESDETVHEREYVTLWLDHGQSPNGATYSYILLPGFQRDEVAAYARAPAIETLANTPGVHAVRRGSVVAANFWRGWAPKVAGIECTGQAAVLMRRDGDRLVVAIADPTQRGGSVDVTIDRPATSVITRDPRFKVRSLRPKIRLTIDVAESFGETVIAEFRIP